MASENYNNNNSNKIEKTTLRDQIPSKLLSKLNEMEYGATLERIWSEADKDSSAWLERLGEFMADWDEFLDVPSQGLFENSSNLHIPMSFWVAKAYHARYMEALLNPEPQFNIKAKKSAFKDAADDIQLLLKHTLSNWTNKGTGVEEAVDQWIWSWVTHGVGYVKWRWECEYQSYIDVEETTSIIPGEVALVNGEEVIVPKVKVEEREVRKTEKVFDGPMLDFRPLENIRIVGRDKFDTRNADYVFDRSYYNSSELNTVGATGFFNKKAVEELLSTGEDQEKLDSALALYKAGADGSGSVNKEYDYDLYEIIECYAKEDIDGSGIFSNIIVWFNPRTKIILRATYLQRVNKQALCPIIPIVFHKRSGENKTNPIGLAEILHPIATEIDAMHNMKVDFGLISTMPFGFYRSGSSLNPREISLEPGTLIPVDDPQRDVYFPVLGNRAIFGLNEEQQLLSLVERITGMSDIMLGAMSGSQGAARTATGAAALVREGSVNLNIPLRRLNRGWRALIRYLLSMLQLKLPAGYEFRATGEDGVDEYLRAIDLNDAKGEFDIEVSPTSSDSDKIIQVEVANQIMLHQQDPVAIQMGIITPQTYYNAIKNKLQAMGVKDISKFLNNEFEQGVSLMPKEEFERIINGFEVKINIAGDHKGFIDYASQQLGDPNLGLNAQQMMLVQNQIKLHVDMMQALETAKQQQANINQMRFNKNAGASNGEI